MKIAVNTRLLLEGRLEGIGWFAYETLMRIVRQHPEHEFHFIFDRPYSRHFLFAENVVPHVAHPQARHPLLWYLFFEWGVKRVLDRVKPDLFFSPDGFLCLRSQVPQVAGIHDLAFEHFPESVPRSVRLFYRHFYPKYAHRAERIVTVSTYSKKDIASYYKVPEEKIDVVYNGGNESFKPLPDEEQQQVRDQETEGQPYFIFIGGLYPRKNVLRLMQAFEAFRQQVKSPVKLLIVGNAVWGSEELFEYQKQMTYGREVIFRGRVGNAGEVNRLLAGALACTYVSVFEGFGIPIVEAMRSGTPVITSSVSSMPEVGGQAACYCDPFSIPSITGALTKVWQDKTYRKSLIEQGFEQEKCFSWQRTADLLFQSLEKASKRES